MNGWMNDGQSMHGQQGGANSGRDGYRRFLAHQLTRSATQSAYHTYPTLPTYLRVELMQPVDLLFPGIRDVGEEGAVRLRVALHGLGRHHAALVVVLCQVLVFGAVGEWKGWGSIDLRRPPLPFPSAIETVDHKFHPIPAFDHSNHTQGTQRTSHQPPSWCRKPLVGCCS